MKRIFNLTICFLYLMASAVWAQFTPVLPTRTSQQWYEPLQAIGGLTFAKNYTISQNSLNADYYSGSGLATFAASRGASNPATTIETQEGNALLFDGVDDEVDVPSDSTINFDASEEYTWVMKVRANDVISKRLTEKAIFNTSGYYIQTNGSGQVVFQDERANTSQGIRSTTTLTEDVDNHIVITYSNGTVLIYINSGSGEGTTIGTPTWADNTSTSLTFFDNIGNTGLPGQLKDYLFYNRALTLAEASTLNNGESVTTNLVSHWDMSDGSGSTLADIVGSNDGTITGAKWLTNGSTYVTKVTADDTARWTTGYYDSSGFTSAPGLLLEGGATNLFVMSSVDGNVTAVAEDFQYSGTERWSVSFSNGGACTSTVADDAPDNIGGKSMSIEITNAGSVDNADVRMFHNNTVNLSMTTAYTVSFWVKADSVKTIALDSVNGDSSLNTTFDTVANTWIRISKTWTTDGVSGNTFIRWKLGDNGLYTIQFTNFQIEEQSYSSSFVPTTTASLTRNDESLRYSVANNFVGGTDVSLAYGYRPISLPDEQMTTFNRLFELNVDGDNGWRISYDSNANNRVNIFTESATANLFTPSAGAPFGSVRYSLHSLVGVWAGTNAKQKLSIDGGTFTSSATNYVVPIGSLPTSMYLKIHANQAIILTGVAIFNKGLSQAETADAHTILTR